MSRTDVPEDRRRDFFLTIDELQNYRTGSIASIFSEARKYRLCLTVAHQYRAQLERDKVQFPSRRPRYGLPKVGFPGEERGLRT